MQLAPPPPQVAAGFVAVPGASASAPELPPRPRQRPGYIRVGDHENDRAPGERLATYLYAPRIVADLEQCKYTSSYFSISAYVMCAAGSIARLMIAFLAPFLSAVTLAELMLVFLWLEPLVAVFVWSRHLGLMWAALALTALSLTAKGFYFVFWVVGYYYYWSPGEQALWWLEACALGVYALFAFVLLVCIANLLKAKLAFCKAINYLEFQRQQQQQQQQYSRHM